MTDFTNTEVTADKKFEATGTFLKVIAVVTMLIDHVAIGILLRWLNSSQGHSHPSFNTYVTIYHGMRHIGRMAFPIYCYMLVEGFFHTRNVKKYAGRLLFVAILSELPFDMALRNGAIDWTHNNVLWNLLIGLVVLCGMNYVDKCEEGFFANEIVRRIGRVSIMLAGMGLGYLLHLDYGYAGVACIAAIYFLYGKDAMSTVTAFAFGVLMLVLMSSQTEVYAFVMVPLMYFYKGHRGADSPALRGFFYLFYPLHLALIYGLSFILL